MTQCRICGRNLSSERFCGYHETAYQNVRESFNEWESRAGATWTEYLDRVSQLEETGAWVIEVIEYLMREDDS
jgi:hypothetical protein